MQGRFYRIAPVLTRACHALGIVPVRVLARAGLAPDTLTHEGRGLEAAAWFAVLEALVAEAGDPDRAVELGRGLAAGPVHPALIAFAASPDIRTGLHRLSLFKPLVAPVVLAIDDGPEGLTIRMTAPDRPDGLPVTMAVMELSYFLELFRIFSARQIVPLSVSLPDPAAVTAAFRRHAGCPVRSDGHAGLTLRPADAALPILSADTAVYRVIELELAARLERLSAPDATAERVRSVLRAVLPSGRVSAKVVASRLGVSTRSLQRRLQAEGTTFQAILDDTRAALAMAYLRDLNLSTEETSLLLAFRDPNSFYRAFHDWTGMTPAAARAAPAGLARSVR